MMKASLKLVLNSGTYTNEDGEKHTGYGFSAFRTDPLCEVYRIDDLSTDAKAVCSLMHAITDNDVAIEHFDDLVEDFCV